ncbi:MAG: DUF4347 domain-containing protein [Pseudomonadota bacterium]
MIVDVIEYAGGAQSNTEIMAVQAHRDVLALPAGTSVAVLVVDTDDLASMVARICNACRAQGAKMRLLRIHSHGQPGTLLQGRLTAQRVRAEAACLRLLQGCFETRAHLYLMSCYVAGDGGNDLLIALARATQTWVTAGTEQQIVGAGATFYFVGPTLTAEPSGRVHPNLAGIPRGPNPHLSP